MIQLSYTNDFFTPNVVWFDERFQDNPDEFPTFFQDYLYLTDKEAKEMLDDPYVTTETKKTLACVLVESDS